jgi:transposase
LHLRSILHLVRLETKKTNPSKKAMGLTTERLRWRIVLKWEELGQNRSATARELSLPLEVVNLWVRRYKATGGLNPAPKSGRKRMLSRGASTQAHQMLLGESQDCAHSVATQLASMGITAAPLDKKTVIRACKRVAHERGKPIFPLWGKPRKQLTWENMQRRLPFSQSNISRSWDDVMITDRKRFLFCYPGAKVHPVKWVAKGSHREASKVNHAAGVNVYGGLTRFGVTKLHEVAGTSRQVSKYKTKKGTTASNITQAEYSDVLMSTLIPEGDRPFLGAWHFLLGVAAG